MKNFGLLILRMTLGLLLAGHGVQKLFGWFKGPGLQGTSGMMEKLGMRPARVWGSMVAVGETVGGVLTALGFLFPVGPLNIMASMAVATRRVHWKLPVWANQGGAELAATNFAAAMALAVAGPGRYSLDRLLGIRLPRWMTMLATLVTAGSAYAAIQRPEVVEKAVNVAATRVPAVGDLVVETRPRQEAPETEEATQPVTA